MFLILLGAWPYTCTVEEQKEALINLV